jgi:hypothetical protein
MPGSSAGWFETMASLGLCGAFPFTAVTGDFIEASIKVGESGE